MNGELRTPGAYRDRSETWEAEHYRRRCLAVSDLVSPGLVEEHRANPFAYRVHHSLALQKVDRLLKTYPAAGRRLVPVLGNDGAWRIMTFTRHAPPTTSEATFDSLEDVVHAIFVLRLDALKDALAREAQ